MLLLERDLVQPDRIVGELLQPGGYLKLKELGLQDCLDDIDAQLVHGYVLFKQGEQAQLNYPTESHGPDVAGRSFHNGRFVQRLRHRAAAARGVSLRQGSVKRLVAADGSEWTEGQVVAGVAYRREGEAEDRIARGCLTVACDGMYSTLRNHLSTPDIQLPSFFVGLLLSGAKLPVPDHAAVVLANPSPILFYPISSTEVRCLVDVPGEKLPSVRTGEMATHLRSLADQVPEQLRPFFLEAVDQGAFRSMQNKLMAAQPLHQAGALLLGDSYNMRHPLTGGGMTVALHDTQLLCDMLQSPLDLADPMTTSQQTFAYYTRRKPWAATINTLANALYKVHGDWPCRPMCAPTALAESIAPASTGVLQHRRVVERGDAAGVLRLPAPGRPLRAGPHLAAVRAQPPALCAGGPLLHGRHLRGHPPPAARADAQAVGHGGEAAGGGERHHPAHHQG